jgi:phospho-N-acetylmuramoyl-pentapeptide-transferase
MGGVMLVAGVLLSLAVAFGYSMLTKGGFSSELKDKYRLTVLIAGVIMALCMCAIGFFDDYIKVVKKRNKGLSIIQKTVLQIVLMVGYLLTLYMNDPTGSMFIPFIGMVETKIFFWVIGFGVIYCTTNAVNFTDGIDGLCGSVTFTAALSFIAIAALRNCFGISLLAAALAGGLVGYLVWNWHPAKVMMGDLGSMFLGGMIVAFAYAVDCPFIILLTGIIYVAEFGSDVLQIGYFKLTHGKRIFKMAPIHHHFEMCGWKEVKIVKIFSLVNLIGGIIAVLLVYFGNLK